MSRTSKTLLRLGVPTLAAATMLGGVPAFLGTANAAHIADLDLQSSSATAAAGTCVPFTATLTFSANQAPRNETIDVIINELDSDANTAGNQTSATQDVDFCTLPTTSSNGTTTTTTQPATAQAGATDSGAAGSQDQAEFVATPVQGSTTQSSVTFGVVANQAGTVNVTAFYEVDGSAAENNQLDASEFSESVTQTFTVGGANAAADVEVISQTQAFAPTQAANAEDSDADTAIETETRTYRVRVADANGRSLAGVPVTFTVAQNPGDEGDRGPAIFGTTDNSGIATGTITFPARDEANSTDTVTFFVNQTDNPSGTQPGLAPNGEEPSDTLVVTIVDNANQTNRTVTLECVTGEAVNGSLTGSDTDADGVTAGNDINTQNPCVNSARDRDRLFVARVDAADTQGATTGTLLAFTVSGGSGDEVVNPREAATANDGTSADTNDSTVTFEVFDPTPTVGQTLTVTANVRGTSASDTETLFFRNEPRDARNIVLTPETATATTNTAQQLTAFVTDAQGNGVPQVEVEFRESGAGAFRNGSSVQRVFTDNTGRAVIETISLPGETGSQTITATVVTPGTQTGQAAGQGTTATGAAVPANQPAGNNSDSSTVIFVSSTPSPTPTATQQPTQQPTQEPTATPTATAPASAPATQCTSPLGISLDRTSITPGVEVEVTVTGQANAPVELQAYSRPNTDYRQVRTGVLGEDGTIRFRVLPGTNTRLFAACLNQTGTNVSESQSVVINVRTALSLTVIRNGHRDYTFQGRILPRRADQLITLYRVDNQGREIRTAIVKTDNTGTWRIRRVFTGSGTFPFIARTSQTLTNAAGASNVRPTAIH